MGEQNDCKVIILNISQPSAKSNKE